MPQESLDDMLLRDAQIQSVQPMIWASLGLAVIGLLGMVFRAPALGIVGWMGCWIAGPLAISRLAPLVGMAPLIKYPLFLACALPGFSLAGPAYCFMKARSERASLQAALREMEARERRREREARGRPAAAAAAASASAAPVPASGKTRTTAPISEALPVLRLVSAGLKEAAELKLQLSGLPAGAKIPEDLDMPPVRATGGVFGVGYHLDAGDTYVSFSHREMQEAGLTLDQVHQRALGNLMKLVKGKPGLRVTADPAKCAYAGFLLDGDHEACLVLLDALWDHSLKTHAPNGAVVALPTRDVLAFCDAHSTKGIAELREMLTRFDPQAKGAVTQSLLIRRHGRWELLDA